MTDERLRYGALEAEMTPDAAKEWDKKIIVRILFMQLELVE